MAHDPTRHRRSIRLPFYDYAAPLAIIQWYVRRWTVEVTPLRSAGISASRRSGSGPSGRSFAQNRASGGAHQSGGARWGDLPKVNLKADDHGVILGLEEVLKLRLRNYNQWRSS